MSGALPVPEPGADAAAAWVAEHLADLVLEPRGGIAASPRFRGGQAAADAALSGYRVAGYAAKRNHVLPPERRGASALSPWIRHGLLPLPRVWDHVEGGPARDVRKFRDELLWQEYARHLYARTGTANAAALRYEPARASRRWPDPWPRDMECVDANLTELEQDGWLVNQTRMWLASQWTVRAGGEWNQGEDRFFAHLLDGSRAANRLGWQWVVGAGTGKPYGFSRYQIRKRAPELCARCVHERACPIEGWPDAPRGGSVGAVAGVREDPDPDATAGPAEPALSGPPPEAVWLTAESLGDADPALAAHPDLPAVFVWDEPLLAGLSLSAKRLCFMAEALSELATRRPVELWRGAPTEVLAGRALATTFAPVPGWRRRSAALEPVAVHPWPWLVRPSAGSAQSFSAWRKRARVPERSGQLSVFS